MSGRTLLVIGGSGFFGKSILDSFARGLLSPWAIDRIVVVARSASRMRAEHPALVSGAVDLVDADVGAAATLPTADLVIHAASSTDARRYAEAPGAERANILRAIDNYCRVAAEVHRDSRIVYASSGAVYGQQPPDLEAIAEDFEPGATADLVLYKRDYAEAKRLAEQRIARLGESGVHTAVARCFAFVGPYLPRDQHFAIGNFLGDGLAGRPIAVTARRPVHRSYMDADDLVRWLLTIADAADATCPVFNVGSDESVTMAEAAAIVGRQFEVGVRTQPLTEPGEDRYIPSIARARERLGLRLERTLEQSIAAIAARLSV